MKSLKYLIVFVITIFAGCNKNVPDLNNAFTRIKLSISKGDTRIAEAAADSILKITNDEKLLSEADSLREIALRIPLDFSLTPSDITDRIQKRLGEKYDTAEILSWEDKGWLESQIINGEKRYFNRAVSNMFLLKNFHLDRRTNDSATAHNPVITFRKGHTQKIIKASLNRHTPVEPVTMEIVFTLTVKPDAVPDGEIIRCWLPYPKENNARQKETYMLGISNEDFLIAPDSSVHKSVYLEGKAEKGKPTVFRISYSYTASGQYFNPELIKALPYDKSSKLYRKFTSEQLPQICFTKNVMQIADSIVGNEMNPKEIVRKIYKWFDVNIPWAGALEYSIMPNIPEYVLANRKGDCGMQTFLLMSMLRYKGVPVKWQSGWMMPADAKNLHDWCEVYFEGTGWVPVDVSFGLQFSSDRRTRDFYISGIDSYRLIVNDGVSGSLYPPKKYLRSDPFDFQRGEVEWKGGNIYYDKWDYDMNITYRKQ